MRYILAILAIFAASMASAADLDEALVCAEKVAVKLDLDFSKFEIGAVDNLPNGTYAVKASMPDNLEYSYVFINSSIIDKVDQEMLNKVVAHELVHVKQTQDGHLVGRLWKGKSYNHKEYMKRPHEREAHKLDDRLAKICQ